VRLFPQTTGRLTVYHLRADLDWVFQHVISRHDFAFDKDRHVYVCPQGKLLRTTGRIHDGETLLYRARTYDCGPCPLKPKFCPKASERKIPRSIYEDARDTARALADTNAFEQSRRDRKRVEMLFAHLKRILRLGRLRLRGPRGAQDEFTLAAIAQNLRRLQTSRPTTTSGRCVCCVTVMGASATASKPPPPGSGWQGTASRKSFQLPRPLIADFCNKIGTTQTSQSRPEMSVRGGEAVKVTLRSK
jgi:hypothetical protein